MSEPPKIWTGAEVAAEDAAAIESMTFAQIRAVERRSAAYSMAAYTEAAQNLRLARMHEAEADRRNAAARQQLVDS